MKSSRRLCLLVPLLAFGFGSPPTVQASNLCPDRQVCVWEHANFGGCKATMDLGNFFQDVRWDSCPGGPYKKVSSWAVGKMGDVQWEGFYTNHKGRRISGPVFCIHPESAGNVPASFNDKIVADNPINRSDCDEAAP